MAFGCMDSSSVQKKNIEEFLNRKSELYDKKDELISILSTSELENLFEPLNEVKLLLTEKEFERLISNRYLIDDELINGNYDESKIESIEYEKVSEEREKITYIVKYIENLYSENQLKDKKQRENEVILEKIDNS